MSHPELLVKDAWKDWYVCLPSSIIWQCLLITDHITKLPSLPLLWFLRHKTKRPSGTHSKGASFVMSSSSINYLHSTYSLIHPCSHDRLTSIRHSRFLLMLVHPSPLTFSLCPVDVIWPTVTDFEDVFVPYYTIVTTSIISYAWSCSHPSTPPKTTHWPHSCVIPAVPFGKIPIGCGVG